MPNANICTFILEFILVERQIKQLKNDKTKANELQPHVAS